MDLIEYSIMNKNFKCNTFEKIELPPINLNKLSENRLTEHNLKHLNNLLPLKPYSYNYSYNPHHPSNDHLNYPISNHSHTDNSKSSSISSIASPITPHKSPVHSPVELNIPHFEITKDSTHDIPMAILNAGDKSNHMTPPTKPDGHEEKKRRQRLGPSCDSCRVRKVKCNAEIEILNTETMPLIEHYKTQGYQIINHNNKVIKFKSCKNCNNKHIDCVFSKGFTKEDILNNKKTGNKVEKKIDGRKTSCVNCRRRKIKCLMNGKVCENCIKKGSECSFI